MKTLLKSVAALGLMTAGATMTVAPLAAQNIAEGVGVVSLPAVIVNSQAFQTAQQQRQQTYAAQIQQAEQRRQQIQQQLEPLVQQFNTAAQAQNREQAQQLGTQIQQIQQNGERELQQLLAPVAASQTYVREQIEEQLESAVQTAARANNVTLILDAANGQVIYADAAYNITQAVLAQLNQQLPSVPVTPPAGWVPREQREQQAAAAGVQAQQPTTQQPTGR